MIYSQEKTLGFCRSQALLAGPLQAEVQLRPARVGVTETN